MQPVRRESNLSVEPAVRAAGANKTMAQKNNRAVHNWMKVKTSLEREQVKVARGLEEDRSKLLKQRERLQNTSLSLTTSPQQTDEPADSAARNNGYVPSSKKLHSLAEVYGELLRTMKKGDEADSMSTKSEPVGQSLVSRRTRSFQIKRVGRKPISFSLGQLQRLNSNSNLKRLDPTVEEEDPGEAESSKTAETLGPFDLNEEELSLGPKLKLAPVCLPPIRNSVAFAPKARDFKKEKLASASSLESAMEDVRYCRYLRVSSGCRRNSAPTSVPRHRFSAWKGHK